jgi:4-amino-4-deoxy-L-arabinose transferase-like glycosyltransferase
MAERMTNGFWPYLILTALCLLLYLPGITLLPPVDRDEPRYAQASRQMIESGDYVRIKFLDVPRNKKPVGIYWLQSSCARLAGERDAIWPYRIPSVLGGIAAVLVLFALGRRLMDGKMALLAAALLAACPVLVVVGHVATTDAVLLALTVTAQACMALTYVRGMRRESLPWHIALLFWLAQGAGILVKGPVIPVISLLTFLALWWNSRGLAWAKGLRPGVGIFVCLLVVCSWPIMFITKAGWPAFAEFLRESLGRDFGGKLVSGQESHGAKPGYYLAVSLIALWPAMLLIWNGLAKGWRERKTDPLAAVCLAWIIPAWILFELVPTKLPHYALPLYPPLFLLVAASIGKPMPAMGTVWKWWMRALTGVWWAALCVFSLVLPAAGWFVDQKLYPMTFIPAVAAAGCGICIWMQRRKGRDEHVLLTAVMLSVLFFVPAFGVILPRLDAVWMSRKTALMVHDYERTSGKTVVALCAGYEEPSLVFALGTGTRLGMGMEKAVAELARNPAAVALIQDRPAPVDWRLPLSENSTARLDKGVMLKQDSCYEAAFLKAATAAGVPVRRVAQVDGFNHTKGRRVRVILYVTDRGGAE